MLPPVVTFDSSVSAARREHRNNERGDRKRLSPDARRSRLLRAMIRKRNTASSTATADCPETARGGEVRSGLLAPRASWRGAVVASAGSEWSDAAAPVDPVVDEGKNSAGPEPRPARAPAGDSRRSRISPGRRSNSTRRGGGVASREGGVRAAPRCCPPTVISLWYSSLFDDNRLQTPALSALCEGEGLSALASQSSGSPGNSRVNRRKSGRYMVRLVCATVLMTLVASAPATAQTSQSGFVSGGVFAG